MSGSHGSGSREHVDDRSDPPNPAILQTLETILRRSQDPDSLSAHCHFNGMRPVDAVTYLSSPSYSLPLITTFMSDPQAYRYQLAVASSRTPHHALPQEIVDALSIERRTTALDISVFHSHWELCFRSEAYLGRALDLDESLLTVNDGDMLAKAKGYKTLLALANVADEIGMIVAGNWYSPLDTAKRHVKDAFLANEKTVQIDAGSLVLMRALTDGRESQRVFERAAAYVRGGEFGRGKIEKLRHLVRKGL